MMYTVLSRALLEVIPVYTMAGEYTLERSIGHRHTLFSLKSAWTCIFLDCKRRCRFNPESAHSECKLVVTPLTLRQTHRRAKAIDVRGWEEQSWGRIHWCLMSQEIIGKTGNSCSVLQRLSLWVRQPFNNRVSLFFWRLIVLACY